MMRMYERTRVRKRQGTEYGHVSGSCPAKSSAFETMLSSLYQIMNPSPFFRSIIASARSWSSSLTFPLQCRSSSAIRHIRVDVPIPVLNNPQCPQPNTREGERERLLAAFQIAASTVPADTLDTYAHDADSRGGWDTNDHESAAIFAPFTRRAVSEMILRC
jgi:hypothetical protein